ncbi:glyoxalase [Actinorhabdospora filicis]|uniref:Glyoxalase n=1 Tax=Actinorhabdospora filicis TaxID=1785913 RepID=A0A9W6SPG5_9ACTN|nr:VOC family protein [Actinorhabdospora filicis]GLZ80590.1 glyoxalase [Actinorhabdospora filicis]
MSARRIMPVLKTDEVPANLDFYGLLGLEKVMDHGWIATLASPSNPTAQISFTTGDLTGPVTPEVSIEVDDVDAAHAAMVAAGAEIVHPLQDEEWGVRRFFVRDPSGRVVNVVGHR